MTSSSYAKTFLKRFLKIFRKHPKKKIPIFVLNIERIQQTLEALYTFLLQKKLEAEITASAIISNILIIDKGILIIE